MGMSITITDRADAPAIAIIIPHYNDTDRLEICLARLMRNDLTRAEIVVVDNASPNPPSRLHSVFPSVRFVTETAKGAGPTRNRGVAETTAPVLAFLDADCVPAEDWVQMAQQVAAEADLVGGRVDVHDETPPPRNGAQAFEKVFGYDFRHYIEVQGVSGAGNLITHRHVFDSVGPFRPAVSEDTDWTRRAVAKGYRLIYRDALRVSHPSRPDWPALRQKWRRMLQESWALAQAEAPGAATRLRWTFKALAMPASALVHLPKVLGSPKLDTWRDRLGGAAVLIMLRLQRMTWMLRQAAGSTI